MDPTLALDWQREHVEWLATESAHQYMTGYIKSLVEPLDPLMWPDEKIKREGAKLAYVVRMALLAGETYAVDDEMMDLVLYAAETLPDDVVHAWTPPTPQGFALLPRTETFRALPPRIPIHVRAFAWSTFGGGVHLFFFSDNDDIRADLDAKYGDRFVNRSLAGQHLSYGHGNRIEFGEHVRRKDVSYQGEVVATSDDFDSEDWRETIRMSMMVLAFWHLCAQTLVSSERARIPRHAEKRWLRAGGAVDHVTRVIRLRRRSGPPVGDGEREWHHRWVVRGHWRQQPCGPGRTATRPVWIAAYVKGPENAPLLVSDKINHLVR